VYSWFVVRWSEESNLVDDGVDELAGYGWRRHGLLCFVGGRLGFPPELDGQFISDQSRTASHMRELYKSTVIIH